jgi:hypothetical protein
MEFSAMTNAVVTELEDAALPVAIACIQALQAFNSNMGSDPALWAAKFPGAQAVLVGQIELQVPALAVAEGGAGLAAINSKLTAIEASLQAKLTASKAAA